MVKIRMRDVAWRTLLVRWEKFARRRLPGTRRGECILCTGPADLMAARTRWVFSAFVNTAPNCMAYYALSQTELKNWPGIRPHPVCSDCVRKDKALKPFYWRKADLITANLFPTPKD